MNKWLSIYAKILALINGAKRNRLHFMCVSLYIDIYIVYGCSYGYIWLCMDERYIYTSIIYIDCSIRLGRKHNDFSWVSSGDFS